MQDHELINDTVNLILSGINESINYVSKLVKLKIKFDENIKFVDALTLPDINISLDLPNLNTLVTHFIQKGYTMADEYLLSCNDKLNDINIILGADAAH